VLKYQRIGLKIRPEVPLKKKTKRDKTKTKGSFEIKNWITLI
jgi:hypothetical protein